MNAPVSARSDSDIVEQVVTAYLRRSRYARVIVDDLRQEAHLAIATARIRFDGARGEWSGYAYRAAWLALASFLVAESSPVTRKEKGAPNPARRVSDTYLFAMTLSSSHNSGANVSSGGVFGSSRAARDEVLAGTSYRELNPYGTTLETAEELVGTAEWNAVVRERVLLVCRGDAELVRILMEETTPAEVAAARGIPVSRVYNAVASARARLSDDLELYSLMGAKNGVQSEESGGERE